MLDYLIGFGVVALIVFLILRPRHKALVALIVMTSSFDLVPRIILGIDTWDIGAVLLMLTGIDVLVRLRRGKAHSSHSGVLLAFAVFYAWMLVCFIWSLLVYDYAFLPTAKFARQMIIGYLSIFIFARLFLADEGSMKFTLNCLYKITFVLMAVAIVQYLIHAQILSGTFRDYSGVSRYLPIFLPFCLIHFWEIFSRMLAGAKIRLHEMIYALMVLDVVVTTYTRGFYATVLLGMFFIGASLLRDKKLKAAAALKIGAFVAVSLAVLVVSGSMERAAARFGSAVDIAMSNEVKAEEQTDTFTGRLKILQERLALVAEYNPLIGYGFLQDGYAPPELMHSLKYGSIIYTEEYEEKYSYGFPYVKALHSADVGWADMVLDTGYVGLILFLTAIAALIVTHFRTHELRNSDSYHLRLALFSQTMLFVILMFESNPFVVNVQMAGWMIAGYACIAAQRSVTLLPVKRAALV
jgi:hypothetical protein